MEELHLDYRTLENYLSVLANTYIISLILPFHKSLVTELKKTKKIYFTDTGLRNCIINNFLPLESRVDKGALLENFILNELKGLGFEVKYWRTTGKAEVDFIIRSYGQLVPVEVKSAGRVGRGFLSFIKRYKPSIGLVFIEGRFGVEEVSGTKVAYLPFFFI
jgi:hypothetical protein